MTRVDVVQLGKPYLEGEAAERRVKIGFHVPRSVAVAVDTEPQPSVGFHAELARQVLELPRVRRRLVELMSEIPKAKWEERTADLERLLAERDGLRARARELEAGGAGER